MNGVVSRNIDLRSHLKRRLELQRLPIEQLHVQQLWLRHRPQLLLLDRLAKPLRHQALQNLLANLFRKLRPDQRLRHLARTKSRNPRQLLVPLHHRLEALRDLIRAASTSISRVNSGFNDRPA